MIDLLLENVGLIIDADRDGNRIREAVRQLAVRGRLVAPEAGAEGCAVRDALRKVEQVKQTLIEKGEIPKPRALGKILDSVSGMIPGHWSATPLSLALESDLTDGDWVESKDQDPDGEVRLTQLADVGIGEFRDRSDRHLTAEKARELRCTYLEPNDVLIARLPAPLGRACLFPGDAKPCVTVVDVAIGRSRSGAVLPEYLALAMNSPMMLETVETYATGTTRKRISTGNLRRTCIPLPPLAEQHRIVAKVDELMEHAVVVKERHLAASSARVRFRDAALHALAEAEGPEAVETAWSRIEENFDDLFTEPEDMQPLRQTILDLLVDSLPRRTNESTVVSPLGKLLVAIEAGRSPSCLKRPRQAEEWGILKVSSCSGGTFRPEENKAAPPGLEVNPAYEVIEGDLLLARSSGNVELVGRAVMVDRVEPRLALCDKTLRLKTKENLATRFLCLVLATSAAREFLTGAAAGAGGLMRNISQRRLRELPIPLPSLAEQHRIVAKVDELMALYDTLEAGLMRAKMAREQFAASISHALTNSELVSA